MGVLDKIFSSTTGEITKSIGNVIDQISTSDAEKLKAKKELTDVVLDKLTKLSSLQSDVLKKEMEGNWLQKSWRPLVMLVFTIIIIAKWFGLTDANISDPLELKLLDIVQLGLGGYVVGRSAEKIAHSVTQNIDMPFIKKKDRNI